MEKSFPGFCGGGCALGVATQWGLRGCASSGVGEKPDGHKGSMVACHTAGAPSMPGVPCSTWAEASVRVTAQNNQLNDINLSQGITVRGAVGQPRPVSDYGYDSDVAS